MKRSPSFFTLCAALFCTGATALSAATIYVAPGGAGDGSSAASPKPSIAAAYAIANQGDIIQMAAGTYTSMPNVPAKAATATWTQNVTVQPAPGATVTVNGTQCLIYGERITLKGLTLRSRIAARRGSNYFIMENCFSQLDPGQVSSLTVGGDHCIIRNNIFDGGTGDADGLVIASGSPTLRCSDILIEDNIIRNYVYAAGGLHEDGIQMYDTMNVTIRRNYITNVGNSAIIFSGGSGNQNMDNVLIENNFISKGAGASSSITMDIRYAYGTNIKVVNNTIIGTAYPVPNAGNVFRNNILSWLSGKNSGEDHNYIVAWNTGVGVVPSPTSHTGPLPAFVDAANGDYHISPANTVDLKFASTTLMPTTDFDGETRTAPHWVGADQAPASTPGLISYDGFNYAVSGNISASADSPTDVGFTGTTWSSTNDVIAGLTQSGYPSEANALQFTSSVGAARTVLPSAIPASHLTVGTDGVSRLGLAGSSVWIAFLIRADGADADGSKVATLNLVGASTGGGTKLSIGDCGANANWAVSKGSVFANSTAPVTVGTTTLLVVNIDFVNGTGNDVVKLYVNPALGANPPVTPSATLTGQDIGAFEKLEFKASRQTTADEVSIATNWSAVIGN